MTIIFENDKDLERVEPKNFDARLNQLVENAETMRMELMGRYQRRSFMATTGTILSTLICAAGFGWFLLMEANALIASIFIILCFILPFYLYMWAESVLKTYKSAFKSSFMPDLAKLLGGFKFYPQRGISSKIINASGIVPKHMLYKAEDCFMGRYKGVKVLFSEARLYKEKREVDPIFEGIFVLLESPIEKFRGHSVLTSNLAMAKRYVKGRWRGQLQNVDIESESDYAPRFQLFSNKPDYAQDLVSDSLLKELGEAADIFERAPITAVFFQRKYIFLSIPYEHDMFEPSHIHMPIQTRQHAIDCKKEIEQILEIIDVFDLYKPQIKGEFGQS